MRMLLVWNGMVVKMKMPCNDLLEQLISMVVGYRAEMVKSASSANPASLLYRA